jgi:phospholipid/cholesterol/gamma-HCH transport system substrate-binding protein
MRGARAELAVGVFALIVLAVLSFITFKVGDIRLGGKKGYTLYAFFDNTAGLYEKSPVRVAGVDAGVVEKIELVDGRARLTLRIHPDVKLYPDASAYIRASGLLGDKYLELRAGTKQEVCCVDGDVIENTYGIVDIDEVVKNVSNVSMRLLEFISELNQPEIKEALKETISNLRQISENVNTIVAGNKEKVESIIANLEELTNSIREEAPSMVSNMNKAAEDLRELLEGAGPNMASLANSTSTAMDSINNIARKIEAGEGTIGKLVNDDQLYESVNRAASGLSNTIAGIDRFRTYLTFRGDYLEEENSTKGQFYLTLKPRKDKYYILGIVRDPVGWVTVTETTRNGETVTEETVEEEIEFTALYARRFKDTAIRMGFIESSFGIGADQFLFNDRVRLTADVWDFNQHEVDSEQPHLKIGADYFLFRSIFISGGMDNILNKDKIDTYAGAGLRFEDEDIKYLLGAVPGLTAR